MAIPRPPDPPIPPDLPPEHATPQQRAAHKAARVSYEARRLVFETQMQRWLRSVAEHKPVAVQEPTAFRIIDHLPDLPREVQVVEVPMRDPADAARIDALEAKISAIDDELSRVTVPVIEFVKEDA